MSNGKAAIASLGMWGSATGLLTLLYKLTGFFGALPPDLITDTQTLVVGTIAAFAALIGRWRAVLPITGLFKS